MLKVTSYPYSPDQCGKTAGRGMPPQRTALPRSWGRRPRRGATSGQLSLIFEASFSGPPRARRDERTLLSLFRYFSRELHFRISVGALWHFWKAKRKRPRRFLVPSRPRGDEGSLSKIGAPFIPGFPMVGFAASEEGYVQRKRFLTLRDEGNPLMTPSSGASWESPKKGGGTHHWLFQRCV
jgi:hypothetical protein